MRKKILTVLVVPVIAALTAQAAAASEHHYPRTKGRAAAIERFRNSNAYAAAGYFAARTGLRAEDEGAMSSGPAGH